MVTGGISSVKVKVKSVVVNIALGRMLVTVQKSEGTVFTKDPFITVSLLRSYDRSRRKRVGVVNWEE